MASPQSGIFALGTASHAYLELDAIASADASALVAAIASMREPRTTMGGVNLVARDAVLWLSGSAYDVIFGDPASAEMGS